jgi:hypothetical protein
LLRARRRAAARFDRRFRPKGPTAWPPKFGRPPADDAFITGNGIAAHCRFVLNYEPLRVNEGIRNNWWFCKSDYLEFFFAEHAPDEPFVLFSHNSDRPIGRDLRRYLRRKNLIAWFAQNPTLAHRKLHALPIGIANPHWPHGDQTVLKRVQAKSPSKRELFDVSFSVETNRTEREKCLEATGLEVAAGKPYPEYLERLASAYFCVSPEGNGIDCQRTWEALYVKTVPIVTRSAVLDHFAYLPMIILDDWSQFRSIDFSPDLYERTIDGWDPRELRLDRYLVRIREILHSQTDRARG